MNMDAKRIEPLVSLICYYLARHEPAYARLHELIRKEWPVHEKIRKVWPPEKLQTQYIDRLIMNPIQHRDQEGKTEFMIELIKDRGIYLIDALPESDETENPRRLATLFYNALVEESLGIDLGLDPITQKKAALNELFGVRPSQIDDAQRIEGDYFGYRRSTTRGAIVRFSLSIRHTGGGIFRFENHFHSVTVDWVVFGTGFFRAGNLYLVGNAASRDGKVGRGLRCFAIRPEPDRESISGIVLTTESSSHPIAARILLVPVRNHRDPRTNADNSKPLDLEKIVSEEILSNTDVKRFWISDEVDVAGLDHTIPVAEKELASEAVVRCIRNGTVSTLRFDGCEGKSIGWKIADEDYLQDESFLLDELCANLSNPTVFYLRAIAGAEKRMTQPRS